VAARSSIFGSFSQVDSSSTRRFGGTGLGLAICQQLVELMEGQLGVESEVEVGSAFWFEIPLLAAESPAEAQPAPREAFLARTGVHARVLVVEDNRVNQLVARKMLERLGCAVDVASNGCEGLQQAGDQLYDLIFMDCQMPEMDGFEATTAIRQLASHPHQRVPIIAVTANVLSKDQDRCAAVGMQGCITKPLNMRDLAAALERHAPRAADRS
jgi:CheY-like chemotaxis protein